MLLVSFVLLIASAVVLRLAAAAHLLPAWLADTETIIVLLGWLGFVFFRIKPGAPAYDIADEAYLRRTVDLHQRRSRTALLLLLCTLVYLTIIYTIAITRKHHEGLNTTFFAGTFAFLALVSVLTLLYGAGFIVPNYRRTVIDELSRAQRAKATQFGHILAVSELAALLVASTYNPQWVVMALPLAIATAIALPGFYFMYLEWRSDRG